MRGIAESTELSHPAPPVEPLRRVAALTALVVLALALVGAVWGLWGQGWRLVGALVLVLIAVVAAWYAVTRKQVLRWLGTAVATCAVLGVLAVVLTAESHGLVLVLLVGLGAVSVLSLIHI